jgi:hypothetical protein
MALVNDEPVIVCESHAGIAVRVGQRDAVKITIICLAMRFF